MSGPGIRSTASQLTGVESKSPLALIQWTIRFCQDPDNLPAFCTWVRGIWPECPYSDAEMLEDLISVHNAARQALS